MMRTIGLLAWRDLLRFGRQRGRLLGAVVAPVVILVFFGAAAESMMRAGDVYRKFLLAGMLVQAMIFSANTSASSLIWDREFGFLKVLTLAPVPPAWVALGKVAGSALQALAHGLVEIATAAGIDSCWTGVGSLFQLWLGSSEPPTDYRSAQALVAASPFTTFRNEMLERRIIIQPPQEGLFLISAAHSDQDVELTLAAATDVMPAVAAAIAAGEVGPGGGVR